LGSVGINLWDFPDLSGWSPTESPWDEDTVSHMRGEQKDVRACDPQEMPDLLIGHLPYKAYYQAFFWVLIDLIIELLDLIIKPFDNKTET
jgi:hypothetical protein